MRCRWCPTVSTERLICIGCPCSLPMRLHQHVWSELAREEPTSHSRSTDRPLAGMLAGSSETAHHRTCDMHMSTWPPQAHRSCTCRFTVDTLQVSQHAHCSHCCCVVARVHDESAITSLRGARGLRCGVSGVRGAAFRSLDLTRYTLHVHVLNTAVWRLSAQH